MAILQWTVFVVFVGLASPMSDSFYKGTEFGLAFFSTFHKKDDHALLNYIVIQSEQSGECTISYIPLSTVDNHVVHHETFAAGDAVKVGLPESTEISLDSQISPKGISVTCSVPVLVYTLDRGKGDANVVHAIPTQTIARNYYVPGVPDNAILGIVAMTDNTRITIHLKSTCKYRYNGRDYSGSDIIYITLQRLQVFELSTGHVDFFGKEGCDLGGTRVTANQDFVLYSGGSCTFFGDDMDQHADGCDKVLIQVPPPEKWGRDFLVSDMRGDVEGYRVRVLASKDNTDVTVTSYNGSSSSQIHKSLSAVEFFTHSGQDNISLVIQSSKPVLVVQFLIFDPLVLIVKPIEHYPIVNQFGSRYIFVTMEKTVGVELWDGYETYLNLIIASGHTSSVRLDGQQLSNSLQWKHFPKLGYSMTSMPLTYGTHMLDSLAPNTPCTVQIYGFARRIGEAYGYTAVTSCSKQCSDLDLSAILTDTQLKAGISDLIGQVGTDATEKECEGACQNSVSSIPRQACAKICPSFLYYKQRYYTGQ